MPSNITSDNYEDNLYVIHNYHIKMVPTYATSNIPISLLTHITLPTNHIWQTKALSCPLVTAAGAGLAHSSAVIAVASCAYTSTVVVEVWKTSITEKPSSVADALETLTGCAVRCKYNFSFTLLYKKQDKLLLINISSITILSKEFSVYVAQI